MKNLRDQLSKQKRTTQLKVRTGLQSGNYLDKCLAQVEQLNDRYQQLLADARRRGLSV